MAIITHSIVVPASAFSGKSSGYGALIEVSDLDGPPWLSCDDWWISSIGCDDALTVEVRANKEGGPSLTGPVRVEQGGLRCPTRGATRLYIDASGPDLAAPPAVYFTVSREELSCA